jgi:hypothetical protein
VIGLGTLVDIVAIPLGVALRPFPVRAVPVFIALAGR